MWSSDRWKGIVRDYSEKDVAKLRGTLQIKYTLAESWISTSLETP